MAINTDIYLGSGASLTFVPEVDLCITLDGTSDDDKTILIPDVLFTNRFLLVPNIYVGCNLDLYDGAGTSVPVSTHIITGNSTNTITISPAHTIATVEDAVDFAVIRSYGAPCFGAKDSSTIRLNADNWLGLVESATFPNVEQEMKQMNLALGGTRNFTHQYKGIRTASGGNINLIANHGAWLYYALGSCYSVVATIENATPDSAGYDAEAANDVYINTGSGVSGTPTIITHTNTGPIFYRTNKGGITLVPPVFKNLDTVSDLEQLTRTTSTATDTAQPITYTFKELNSEDLPSFALEQSIAKDPTTLTTDQYTVGGAAYNNETEIDHTASTLISVGDSVYGASGIPTGATVVSITDSTTFELSVPTTAGLLTGQTLTFNPKKESNTFTRIARGNRVNTLTMTANENEEVKMTMDLNTRMVTDINQEVGSPNKYEARAGTEINTNLFNYPASGDAELLDPFFFSSGSFSIFGEQFLKITNLSLTINNNLMDKRFIGIGSKDIKSAIPAQRNYELTFTALVTDDAIFQELFNETENNITDTVANGLIQLKFDKADGEQIDIKLQDYFLSSSNITIPDDKGPITIEGTVMPRTLNSCTIKTHWVLQG